ncbi:MAG TPA: site-2 protease family protein [Thermoanaerobaculia bacterium]|nr:site-2 protease family protein [Thermoanaerobaculia bacterium]
MFGRRIELFKVFGFPINLDPSWFFIAVLLTLSLAQQYFPQAHPGLPSATYWAMGVAGALGLFVSVVLHELSHAVVARRYGLRIRGITLFLFGGVAEMADEPPTPKAEFWMAIAGPVASVLLGLAFSGLAGIAAPAGHALGWPVPVVGVLAYLGFINLTLGIFNLVPAFPLDGGRVLRSALWHWKKSLRWATRITSAIGSGFGLLLMGLGLLSILRGMWGGLWFLLVGLFVRGAAASSYQQLLLRRALEGEPVAKFMRPDPVTVPRGISVEELVHDYIYRHHFKMFPVVDDAGRLWGCVTTRQVKELPREEWDRQTVGALAARSSPENTVTAETDAMRALSRMNRNGASRLMVVDGDRLLGILTLKDLMRFFALKMELEEAA